MRELNQNELEGVNGAGWSLVAKAVKWLMSARGAAVTTAATTAQVAHAPTANDPGE